MQVIGYIRVSTEEQAGSGCGVDAQEHSIRRYCELHGHDLVGIERDEGESGKSLDRPAWRRVESWLRRGRGVVVSKLDRMTRSVGDVVRLMDAARRRGWHVHSVHDSIDTSSATGRLLVHVLASFAQFEREQIMERTSAALLAKQRRGEAAGGNPPYGKRREGKRLVDEPREIETLLLMKSMRGRGAAYSAIATHLNVRGMRMRNGGEWSRQVVHKVLRRAS